MWAEFGGGGGGGRNTVSLDEHAQTQQPTHTPTHPPHHPPPPTHPHTHRDEFAATLTAMRVLGFPEETVDALLRLVAGLLHLGQVGGFVDGGDLCIYVWILFNSPPPLLPTSSIAPIPPAPPQVGFTPDDATDGSQVDPSSSHHALETAAALMGLAPEYVVAVLTTRVVETRGEAFTVQLRPAQVGVWCLVFNFRIEQRFDARARAHKTKQTHT